jgi:hypothetical protein
MIVSKSRKICLKNNVFACAINTKQICPVAIAWSIINGKAICDGSGLVIRNTGKTDETKGIENESLKLFIKWLQNRRASMLMYSVRRAEITIWMAEITRCQTTRIQMREMALAICHCTMGKLQK